MSYRMLSTTSDLPHERVVCAACGFTLDRPRVEQLTVNTTSGVMRLREAQPRDLCPACGRGHLGIPS